MRACVVAAIAVLVAGSAPATAADVAAGGPVVGSSPYAAYSPRIEPLIVYDYQPGVIVRSYWWAPWQNRHYFPKTGKRPKVGRLERMTARKGSPPADFYRSWSVSSVFAPEFPPLPIERYMGRDMGRDTGRDMDRNLRPYAQPDAGDPAPSLAHPK